MDTIHKPAAEAGSEDQDKARLKAEKEAAAKAAYERLLKRSGLITNTIRKFLASWTAARKQEMDALRAAEAAKALAKSGKKGGRKAKAPAPAKETKKKPAKTPVAEAWSGFMSGLDQLVNKAKRVSLEDMYRAVGQLEPEQQRAFASILATANKKVLPTENMNLNQLNLKEAIFAASAAYDYTHEKANFGASLGLQAIRDKGASATLLLTQGFKESELLRVGFSKADVIAVTPEPARLRQANITVSDLVSLGLPEGLQGYRGMALLRQAGYTAHELVTGGLRNAWDLRRAGYSVTELLEAGLSPEDLRTGGFGLPDMQPAAFLARSMHKLQEFDPRLLPDVLTGTRGEMWQQLLQPMAPVQTVGTRKGSAGSLQHNLSQRRSRTPLSKMTSRADMRVPGQGTPLPMMPQHTASIPHSTSISTNGGTAP